MRAAPETRKPASSKETGSQKNGKAGSTSTSEINQNSGDLQPCPSAQKRWNDAHPLERWAHAAVESAIRRGLMTRQPCAICGDPKTDAHHEPGRYQEPLTAVTFLCRLHHRREHRRLKCEATG